MKYIKTASLVLLLLAISACAFLGVPQAQSFNQKVYAAYTSVEAAANTTNTLLVTGKLSKADGSNIHEQLVNIKAALDISRSVHDLNPDLGDKRLEATLITLQALQVYVGGIK